jgi:predicted GIY-YIG superfamily endonuclease
MSKGGTIYILSNRPDGVLYIGVTNDLIRRVFEHRGGVVQGFSKTHGLKRLVYYEQYDDIRLAIQRERTMSIGRERGRSGSSMDSTVIGMICIRRSLRETRRGWPGQARP